ncbi:MAG: FtsW/RodA/SpoVE family cell cycle protein [Niabella sp.]
MKQKKKIELYSRNTERVLLLFITVIIAVMAFNYYNSVKAGFRDTDEGYAGGANINLTYPLNADAVKKALTKGGYFSDENYINFITQNLKKKVDEEKVLPNLGALNKEPMLIEADAFMHTGESGKLRFINSLAHLGMDSALYAQERSDPKKFPSEVNTGIVKDGVSVKGTVNLSSGKKGAEGREGILIKLTRIFPGSYFDTVADGKQSIQAEFYARTDAGGNYQFTGLDPQGNYSVLVIKPGYDFGTAKGAAAIGKSRVYDFTGKPHHLRLLDRVEYRKIKSDKIFTVRTPQEFKKQFFTYLVLFILSFWILHIALYLKNYRSDQFILPLIMFILSIGIMILYSTQDPLRDEIYGTGMALYASLVLIAFSVLVFVFRNNPVNRFYHSKWFDPVYTLLPAFNKLKAPRGYSWLLASIILMLLLALFGTGPEGSGVKVNLFGLQVSELSKYLMVVFFAAYFTVNAGYFKNIPDNRWLTKNNLLMILMFAFLLGIYAVLGDLGPAIVLCLTFLFFYSFAKEEFFQMILAAIIFALLLFATAKLINAEGKNYLPLVASLACLGTFIYALLKKKYESVFFIVLIISSFILLAALPFNFTERLADRNSMFANMWENKLVGGDQVAQGVWSLNSGGILGQGLGKGFSNVMPAHHTDMILESIGEELGLITLITIFFAFGLLVYRCILAARRTGKSFMFYMMAGIAIATMLQFMLITAGTLGLVPLTGISVPFLSKGNAGIIVTLIAFLFVLIMSNEKGNALEMEYVKKNFDNVNTYAILTFFAVVLIFTGSLIWYQAKSDEYIVKPSLALNRNGEWQYSYNPRIGLMLREIKAGNIYDKNGVLLATSAKSAFDSAKTKLINLGANPALYNEQLNREQDRYYPFAADLLFWLGDYNKEIAREESAGYAAEFRHFTALRGFDVKYTTIERTSDRYKENRFLPETTKETDIPLYDYSALAPFIKAGKNSELIALQNNKQKDIWLSLDVLMNEKINAIIQTQAPYKNFRTSVIAVNAYTGDVLASASNPAPSYKDLKLISNIEPGDYYRDIYKQIFGDRVVVPQDLGITYTSRPGSTIKLVDAYAAINQHGLNAANFSFFVYPAEAIRADEPSNENVDMHKAIVRSSNVYFIKLANEKNLQSSLFNMYDLLGMNIINRGGFNFKRPADYNSEKYFKEWDKFVSVGKGIYNTRNKRLMNTRKRFQSNYSNIAWGQGELMATPLQLAKMSAAIANKDTLQPSRFLYKAWNQPLYKEPGAAISKYNGASSVIASFMQEQSAKVGAASGLEVHGKTGSPERDKLIKENGKILRKRVTDAWYTFFVRSPKLGAPIAFAIRIEEIGNSEFAKQLAVEMLKQLKASGYF